MDPTALSTADAAALRAVLEVEGVDGSYLAFVVRHVDLPDRDWRWCCGSQCDPCVQRLGRAVDRARELLHRTPPGLPGIDGTA